MRSALFGAAAAVLMTSAASAATFSYTVGGAGSGVGSFSNVSAVSTQTLSLPSFNAGLGTLNFATWNISLQFATSGSIQNVGASSANMTVVLRPLTPGNEDNFFVDIQSTITSVSGEWTSEISGVPGGASQTFSNVGPSAIQPFSFSMTPYTNNGNVTFADALGPDPIEFVFNLNGSTYATAGGASYILDATTVASGWASVTYNYDTFSGPSPVPLPAALPLLGAGLAGLAFIGRRRKS
ncbi:MAG: choice-of-anchor E domain-containing protein [Albimonas sp.]|uniref:choice-of-anchor E domain-containing protein n=1 Tax=Albimonas sp. TaxID=1872425 RepID=UPI004057273D|tara:strand:+ start:1452 stop:2168 length:717 start_codon:yes stop_codon:yes gene_type:complete